MVTIRIVMDIMVDQGGQCDVHYNVRVLRQ
jgi:hypothetical protein